MPKTLKVLIKYLILMSIDKYTERFWDVIVIGHGNAALSAANAACDRGKSVLVLEAAPENEFGGNSRYVEVYRAAHRKGEFGHPYDDYTEDDYFNDIVTRNQGDTDRVLARILADRSRDMIRWLVAHGVKFAHQTPADKQYDPDMARSGFRIVGGGMILLHTLLYHFLKSNRGSDRCKVLYNAKVVDIEVENREFRSVVVNYNWQSGGKLIKIKGDQLIIASGSFVANLDRLREIFTKYLGLPLSAVDNIKIRGFKYNDGIPLFTMVEKYGAATVGDLKLIHAPPQDARAIKFGAGIAMRVDSVMYGIVINKYGERFADEGADFWIKMYSKWGYYTLFQPDQLAFSIFDSKAWGLFAPTYLPPISANSLEELVQKLREYGLENPKRALETIYSYNAACPKGKKPDYSIHDGLSTVGINPPKSNWAVPIDTPPFYAYPIRPGLTFVYWALKIDDKARVLHSSGNPFINIYATGESMFANITRRAYIGGTGIGMGTTFGIIAAYEGGWP